MHTLHAVIVSVDCLTSLSLQILCVTKYFMSNSADLWPVVHVYQCLFKLMSSILNILSEAQTQ